METSTGQGLTEEGNWKPPHHGAGKPPPFTVQKNPNQKNPNLTTGQEDLNGLLQTTPPYLSLPISPVSSCWPCCPAHSQGTWQQGSKKGTLAPARLFGGKLGEATQNSECTRKSTFASRESSASAGSWAGSPTAPRASAGSSTHPSPTLLSADAECSEQAPSSFGGRGLMKSLGAGGLNLEETVTSIMKLQ